MAVSKIYTNKSKTKISWKVVAYIPTQEFDSHGKQIYKHHYVGCYATEKEGKKAERDFLNNLEGGKVELNDNATGNDIILFYIDYAEKEGRYAKGTVENYKCIHKHHIGIFDTVLVKKITPALIRLWRKSLVEKGLSPYRINDCIKLLKSAYNYAIREKVINSNPFADVRNETLPKKVRRRFSAEELGELLSSCKKILPDYYCIFALSCLTGMRVGEYSALTIDDIDFRNKFIYVTKQYTKGELKTRTKTVGSTRVVHPSDMTLEILKWHISRFNIKEGLLFKNSEGKPVSAKWVSRRFNKLLLLNDYPEKYVRVHDLRGQYVDIQHSVGTPTEQIAKEVGHSRTSTTSDIYSQILKEVPREMNKRMDKKIFGKTS